MKNTSNTTRCLNGGTASNATVAWKCVWGGGRPRRPPPAGRAT
jgi:hypothetical protein